MKRDDAKEQVRKLLGDRVAALAEKTGVAAVVRAVERATGWRCGCERRVASLNRLDRSRIKS